MSIFDYVLYLCGIVLPYSVGNARLSASMLLTMTIILKPEFYFGLCVRSNAVRSQFFSCFDEYGAKMQTLSRIIR